MTTHTSGSRLTLEAMTERLLATAPTLAGVAQVLGGQLVSGVVEFEISCNHPPFQAIHGSEYRRKIDLLVRMAEGNWKVSDLTIEPAAFGLGPRLPDTGALEAGRTWEGPLSIVTWIVRVSDENEPMAARTVQGDVRCQIIPR